MLFQNLFYWLRKRLARFSHEKFDLINPVLDSVSFWIEGVSLTIVAIVGLLGNLLTVIVLPKLGKLILLDDII